ncbi:MAG: hypothetical protein SGJ01_07640 [Gemmatimonadota bacterium]|nr:hypothetical protein [Gemmatimonadota bacterium]
MFREVQVNPAFASHYPALLPGRWYTAAAVAGLVKGTRIIREGSRAQFADWILPPDHFVFRGGSPRRGNCVGLWTRRLDRHPAVSVAPSRSLNSAVDPSLAPAGA